MEQQDIIHRYVAKRLIGDLRARVEIDSDLLRSIRAYPIMKYCFSEVHDEDKDLLKEIAASADNALSLRLFVLTLLGQYKNHPDVKQFLFALWKSSSEYEIKIEILWNLLSYNDLPDDLLGDISRNFIASDWDKWLPLIVERLGGDDQEKMQVNELMSKYFDSKSRTQDGSH